MIGAGFPQPARSWVRGPMDGASWLGAGGGGHPSWGCRVPPRSPGGNQGPHGEAARGGDLGAGSSTGRDAPGGAHTWGSSAPSCWRLRGAAQGPRHGAHMYAGAAGWDRSCREAGTRALLGTITGEKPPGCCPEQPRPVAVPCPREAQHHRAEAAPEQAGCGTEPAGSHAVIPICKLCY